MSFRRCVIAITAAVAVAAGAQAEPTKAPVRNGEHAAEVPAPVVVASAETVKSPAPVAEAQTPAEQKRVRKARVSTCRCGVQTPAAN